MGELEEDTLRVKSNLTVPRKFLKDAGINKGDYVKITSDANVITIKKVEVKEL